MRKIRKEIGNSNSWIQESLEFSEHMGTKTRFITLRKWKAVETAERKNLIRREPTKREFLFGNKNKRNKQWKW